MWKQQNKNDLTCTKELPRFLIRNNRGQEAYSKYWKKKKKIIRLRFVFLATLSFKNEDEIIVFSNNVKREFIVSRPDLTWNIKPFRVKGNNTNGNLNPQEEMKNTRKVTYEVKYKELHKYIFSSLLLMSLKEIRLN